MDEVLDADEPVLAKGVLYEFVGGQRDPLSVDFSVAPLVDEVLDNPAGGGAVKFSVSDRMWTQAYP